jgi:hypothetical protein
MDKGADAEKMHVKRESYAILRIRTKCEVRTWKREVM